VAFGPITIPWSVLGKLPYVEILFEINKIQSYDCINLGLSGTKHLTWEEVKNSPTAPLHVLCGIKRDVPFIFPCLVSFISIMNTLF